MTKVEKNYNRMVNTNVYKLIILLGIPTTISMLITNIYNLADTYFVGTLGESPQAATAVLFTLQCIIQAFAFMLGQGAGTHLSKSLANKDTKQANSYVTSAFFIGFLVGLLLMMFGLIFLEPFVKLLGSTDSALKYSKEYGLWILIAAPFMIGSLILNNSIRFEGKAFYAMFGISAGGLLNIFGDYIFINVMDLGIFGAGMSTGISQIISFIILIIMQQKFCTARLNLKDISRSIKTYFEICRAGFPSLIRQGLTAVSNGILNMVCKPYGDSAQAAMGIVSRYVNFALCIGIGIGQGFQPFVAFNYQAKKYKRVIKGLLFTFIVSVGSVFLLAILGMSIPKQLIRIFQDEKETIRIGSKALVWASIGVIFVPMCTTTNMLYQSIRKSEIASLLALLRSGLVFIPLVYILKYYYGLGGIKVSMPISNICAGLFSIPFLVFYVVKSEKIDYPSEN
ncbi:MAG: MATE family efflux transporter [Acholeplasmatales bacterium]|nr:MATE family efflux transporter [Acholeplasmatales bacterium]